MLLVKTYVGKSPVHGRGLFAAEDIMSGTVIWRAGCEMLFTRENFAMLSEAEKRTVSNWGWLDKIDGMYHLPLDNDRFINHSDAPNTRIESSGLTIASRTIRRGEEILCDYREFEAEFRFANL